MSPTAPSHDFTVALEERFSGWTTPPLDLHPYAPQTRYTETVGGLWTLPSSRVAATDVQHPHNLPLATIFGSA